METQTKKQTVAFAYFGDGVFLGWYADTFGSIRKYPKLYTASDEQFKIIQDNFLHKLSTIADLAEMSRGGKAPEKDLIDTLLSKDYDGLTKYAVIELKAVLCPFYDGPNPEFDTALQKEWNEQRLNMLKAKGVLDMPTGDERSGAIILHDQQWPKPEALNLPWWIYADRELVNAWALTVPTEFIEDKVFSFKNNLITK